MKEMPILFSTAMVQANLDGRKMKTRRIIDPQPIWSVEADGNLYEGNHKGYVKVDGHADWQEQFAYQFAKWKKGDLLWVRETWNPWYCGDGMELIEYAADGVRRPIKHVKKYDNCRRRPGIHMDKEYARIWLQVTDVRVERLQDISEQDAIAEGIWHDESVSPVGYTIHGMPHWTTAKECFTELWEGINGPGSWKANPFVWVISFAVLSTTGKPDLQTIK